MNQFAAGTRIALDDEVIERVKAACQRAAQFTALGRIGAGVVDMSERRRIFRRAMHGEAVFRRRHSLAG